MERQPARGARLLRRREFRHLGSSLLFSFSSWSSYPRQKKKVGGRVVLKNRKPLGCRSQEREIAKLRDVKTDGGDGGDGDERVLAFCFPFLTVEHLRFPTRKGLREGEKRDALPQRRGQGPWGKRRGTRREKKKKRTKSGGVLGDC